MKKVLLTGAALMLVGGMVSTETYAAVEPGVKITGDARVRFWYTDDAWNSAFGNTDKDSEVTMDSRVRLNVAGTAAGGAYAKARIRMMESNMGDGDTDALSITHTSNANNIWVDQAYVGIPFADTFTLEIGKYRSTYGPLGLTNNFFYDDVNLTGFRGIIKMDNIEINPFVEWMEEAQWTDEYNAASSNSLNDNDEIRFGAHIKTKINKDWTVGGMLGYQSDARNAEGNAFETNEGFFGSIYTKGQSGAFGIVGELGVTDGDLNGFNSWYNDAIADDEIGSEDTGFGGYIFPNYQIDKLNIGLNLGFTTNGFVPDNAFGFVMLGGNDNSKISLYRTVSIGTGGDWLWAGLVTSYQIAEDLKLTGNLVYADVDGWNDTDEGPWGAQTGVVIDSAWELSAVLQYTISKGADVYFSAGYLAPDVDTSNPLNLATEDDGAFGALTRFELKF